MIFALSLPVLALAAVAGVDINRASSVRMSLQDALDAAALAAARSGETTSEGVRRVGMSALRANLAAFPDVRLDETAPNTTFVLNADGSVDASARAAVETLIAQTMLGDDIAVGVTSQVLRAATSLEVSLVLDTTGSMQGQRIVDLRAAANDLVDLVVADIQTPYYSRVAVVPYSMAVNPGTYADAARGAITPGRSISGASWSTGPARSISGANRAGTVTITASNHGFANGDWVYITGVNGMTQLNNRAYVVSNRAANTFRLSGVNSSNYNSYSSGGTVRRCQVSDCDIVITANNHGLDNGDRVYFTGINGLTPIDNDDPRINNGTFIVANRTVNTYSLNGVTGADYTAYSSSGTSFCTVGGCQYYSFINAEGDRRTYPVSSCVTERGGGNAFNDAAPGSSPLGRNYPSSTNPCLTNTIMPLSADRAALSDRINGLTASGSTGGHIGVGWGWYMLSPNFASLFPTTSQGAAYNLPNVLKAVVIMTDGEYNSGYCNGVISRDSTSGSGGADTHINCNAPNGHPFSQTAILCDRMKAAGIIVYTVGFNVVNDQRARDIVANCATDSEHAYYPTSGSGLRAAFQDIGQDLHNLRISR